QTSELVVPADEPVVDHRVNDELDRGLGLRLDLVPRLTDGVHARTERGLHAFQRVLENALYLVHNRRRGVLDTGPKLRPGSLDPADPDLEAELDLSKLRLHPRDDRSEDLSDDRLHPGPARLPGGTQ